MLPREHYLKQTFQDAVNFPDGLEKGGLSDVQARLIRKHGVLINALMQEEVSDPTTDDQHMLKVIANQSAPKSPVEQAWVKYLAIVKARQASAPAKTKAKPKPKTPTESKEEDKPKVATTKPAAKTTRKATKTEAS
jgi:uncharacterized protein YifE (UPF0438 family)